MNRVLIITIGFYLITALCGVQAADFYVGNEAELVNALTSAETLDDADVIYIDPVTINITSGLEYSPPNTGAEFFSLSIVGAGGGSTVLKWVGPQPPPPPPLPPYPSILYIYTKDLGTDANTQITIEGVTFEDGDSDNVGGGLYVLAEDADVTVSGCYFLNNNATNFGGGAVFEFNTGGSGSGSLTLTNNTFFGNVAGSSGGGIFLSADYSNFETIITNNSFSGNSTAINSGGGVYLLLADNSAIARVYNNIIYGNTAGAGGDDGDDLYIFNLTGATVNLYNNNLGDQADLASGQSEDLWVETTGGGAYNQADNMTQDPMFIDETSGDLHLQSGSPVIDAGDDGAPSLPSDDIDGDARIIGSAVDIGSDEAQPVQTLSGPTGSSGGCFITSAQR